MPRRPTPPWSATRTAVVAPLVAAAALIALTACRPIGLAATDPMTGPTAAPPAAAGSCTTAATRSPRPQKDAVPIAFTAAEEGSGCPATPCPAPPTAAAPQTSRSQPSATAKPAPAPATPRRVTPLTALPTAPPYVRPVAEDDTDNGVPAARCPAGAPRPTGTPR